MKETMNQTYIPELGAVRRGKVRDIYETADGKSLVLISSDRISCFDRVLAEQIPHKGQILNEISRFWFEQTQDIIPNHILECPDPNVVIAKKCRPLPVEIILRGYICGSMWRAYANGARTFCGVDLPEGLQENQKLIQPILTPTTKVDEGHDQDITAQEILELGLVDPQTWKQIETVAPALFQRGQDLAKERGLILVDTKYEFGLDTQGDLVLIDEVHTPDSSRFWFANDLERKVLRFPDKEFVRGWLREQGFSGDGAIPVLAEEIVNEASSGYISIYETILGRAFSPDPTPINERVMDGLKSSHMIKGCFALIMAGSTSDKKHVEKICSGLKKEGIPHRAIYASAHKQPEEVLELMKEFNNSLEPIVMIAVAGMSNALGGVLGANMKWPVINCPPFKDQTDYLINIHSSLQMPRNVPAMTVVHPGNAALAAARILRLAWRESV